MENEIADLIKMITNTDAPTRESVLSFALHVIPAECLEVITRYAAGVIS